MSEGGVDIVALAARIAGLEAWKQAATSQVEMSAEEVAAVRTLLADTREQVAGMRADLRNQDRTLVRIEQKVDQALMRLSQPVPSGDPGDREASPRPFVLAVQPAGSAGSGGGAASVMQAVLNSKVGLVLLVIGLALLAGVKLMAVLPLVLGGV